MCTISVCRILFSQHYRYVFCATATSVTDHPVWFHGSRGESFSSLLGIWHRGKRSVQDIVDQIQIKISSPGGIAEGVQVPTLRTSSALTPSTGQGPQKPAKPQVATNPKFPKSPNAPIGAPHPRKPAGVSGMVWGEIDGQPQRAMRGPQLPIMGSGTVTSAENRAVIDSSTGVIERTNAAPSRTPNWGTMASPMGPIMVDSGTPLSLGGLPEPQLRKNLFVAGLISPIDAQLDAENRRVLALTPDPHGHLRPAREAVALIQQALSGNRQNPTMVESWSSSMSGSRRFPSLVEEFPALGAYPNPPSGSRLNPTIMEESPTQIEEDECDQWFPLAVEQGKDDEEEEIGVLERHELHLSPISVASAPAPPELMSGTRDCPVLMEASPAPHYIMVEDSLAPQFSDVEESPVPLSGIKNHPCLVVEPPEPTEDRAGTRSPVSMSGTKDCPSPVDDSPAMPNVNKLCWGGGNLVEGGSATLPINLVSPPTTTSHTEDPQMPNWGGGPEVATGPEPVFASHPRTQSPLVVHESPQYIVVDEFPSPPPRPNTVGLVPPPPSPRHHQVAYIEHVQGILHLVRPSSGGGSRGGTSLQWGGASTCCCAPHTPVLPCGGALRSLCGRGGCWGGRWRVIPASWRGGSIVSTFWGPRSYTGGGRPTAHVWLFPVCGAL